MFDDIKRIHKKDFGDLSHLGELITQKVKSGELDGDYAQHVLRDLYHSDSDKPTHAFATEVENSTEIVDFQIKSIKRQVGVWKKLLPGLDSSYIEDLTRAPLPKGTSWGIFPKSHRLGIKPALEKMTVLIPGLVVTDGERFPYDFSPHTAEFIKFADCPGDFLAIPIRLTGPHANSSVRRARLLYDENEFGMPIEFLLALLAGHPEFLRPDVLPNKYYLGAAGSINKYGDPAIVSTRKYQDVIKEVKVSTTLTSVIIDAQLTGFGLSDEGTSNPGWDWNRMFASPKEQLANIKRWNNEFKWGFTPEDFTALPAAPKWPDNPRYTAVVLVPYMDDPMKTFTALHRVLSLQKRNPLHHLPDNFEVRLLQGINHTPGLKWEVISFEENYFANERPGSKPAGPVGELRSPTISPHAGIMAAAAHAPSMLKKLADKGVGSTVWMPGYEVNGEYQAWDPPLDNVVLGGNCWDLVPYLYWNSEAERTTVGWHDRGYQNMASVIPEFHQPLSK